MIPLFIYLPSSLHKTSNDRKFENLITYADNLKSTHKNKNISSENRGHSSIDKTHLGINSCNEISMDRKSNEEMVARKSDKVIDAIHLDSIKIVTTNTQVQLQRKSRGTESWFTLVFLFLFLIFWGFFGIFWQDYIWAIDIHAHGEDLIDIQCVREILYLPIQVRQLYTPTSYI